MQETDKGKEKKNNKFARLPTDTIFLPIIWSKHTAFFVPKSVYFLSTKLFKNIHHKTYLSEVLELFFI